MTVTRFDIAFAVQRLAEYNSSPTSVAFQSIGRVAPYLASDVLRPLMFPRGNLSGKTTLRAMVTPQIDTDITIPNHLCSFSDAEFACNLANRKSYTCVAVMLMGVCIYFKKSAKLMQS